MERYDIVLSDSGELQEKDGDIVVGDASKNLIKDIITAAPGHYKEVPEIGAAIIQFLHSNKSITIITRQIRAHLEYGGFKGVEFDVSKFQTDGEITIYSDEKV